MKNDNSPQLWYGNMYCDDQFAFKRIELYIQLIAPYLKPKVKVLDIGCYNSVIYDLLPRDIDYYGVDFDEKALEIAKSKGAKVKFVKFDDEEITFDHKFDIIICTEVLEHLKNPKVIIDNIKKMLKDDGVVLFSFPNECTIYHRIMCLLGKGIDTCVFELFKHLHFPTIKQSRIFIKENFKIIKEAYFVNPGGKNTRWEGLGRLTSKIPYSFWASLARLMPGLFARGIVFLAKKG